MAEPMTRREKWYLGVIIVIMLVGGAMWAHRPQHMPIQNSPVNQAVQPTKPHWTERYQTLIAGLLATIGGVSAIYAGRQAYKGPLDAAKIAAETQLEALRRSEEREKRAYEIASRAVVRKARFRLQSLRNKIEPIMNVIKIMIGNNSKKEVGAELVNCINIIISEHIPIINEDDGIQYFNEEAIVINFELGNCIGFLRTHIEIDIANGIPVSVESLEIDVDMLRQCLHKLDKALRMSEPSHLTPPPSEGTESA